MENQTDHAFLIRMHNSGFAEAFSECDRRRREAGTAEVMAALEEEFGPPNKIMAPLTEDQKHYAQGIRTLNQPKWWLK